MVKTKILLPLPENIDSAATLLRAGEVVAIPTETVYGLAGNVWNERALQKIFEAKGRPTYDPLIVHVEKHSPEKSILEYLAEQNLIALDKIPSTQHTPIETVLQKFWPGPLTIILPKHERVPNLVTSNLKTVAIRMPAHPVAQAILRATQLPLAAPSANRFGRISPTKAIHAFEELEGRIPLVIDGGACEIGLESTIVALLEHEIVVLRPGAISADAIATITKNKIQNNTSPHTSPKVVGQTPRPQAPGMLDSHYAPQKALYIFSHDEIEKTVTSMLQNNPNQPVKIGLLVMAGDATQRAHDLQESLRKKSQTNQIYVLARELSFECNFQTMAKNFFSVLRDLDHSAAEILFSDNVPEPENITDKALARALADRLKRASKKI